MKRALQATVISAALVFSLNISATESNATEVKIKQAMQLDYRTEQMHLLHYALWASKKI